MLVSDTVFGFYFKHITKEDSTFQ